MYPDFLRGAGQAMRKLHGLEKPVFDKSWTLPDFE
jgi:hypothetical protein